MSCSALAALTFLLAAQAAHTDEPITLKPRFEPNTKRYVELSQQIDQWSKGAPFGPEGRRAHSERARGVWQTSQKSAEDRTALVFTYERLQARGESRQGPVAFDSDLTDESANDPVLAAVFKPMLGLSFTVDLDAEFQVLGAKGMGALLDKVEESAAGNPVFNQLQDELTDDNARLIWADQRLVLFPGKPVTIGDTWTKTFRTRGVYLGELERDYRCTFDRVDTRDNRRFAVVRYEANVRRPADAQTGARLSATALTLRSGRIEGSARFDFERGEFVEQTDTMITLLDGSRPAKEPGETVAIEVETTTRQTLRVLTEEERLREKATRGASPNPTP